MNPDDIFFAAVKVKDQPAPPPVSQPTSVPTVRGSFLTASTEDWVGSAFVISVIVFFLAACLGIISYG